MGKRGKRENTLIKYGEWERRESESYARLWMKGKRGGKTSDKLRKKGRRENL